jgi:ubiquinone/menaquinone biosynthesis C-methylase UbiE
MKSTEIFRDLIDKDRNIYQLATLYEHNRKEIDEYVEYLVSPSNPEYGLTKEIGFLVCQETGQKFKIENNISDLKFESKNTEFDKMKWEKKNTSFLNYHKSLTVYEMLRATPLINYISEQSGIGELRNIKVVDVGGGTGHTLCSFFKFPDEIDYYLLDPNIRLLHDQFIRIYPKLLQLKIGHILAYAESIPFQNNFADVILSISAIDHYKSYIRFFEESYRVLKDKGKILVSGHIEIPEKKTSIRSKIFSYTLPELLIRNIYRRRYRVGLNDHTFHFRNIDKLINALKDAGFRILNSEMFKRYYFITAEKQL